jgi:hypothetical protein
MTRLRIRSGIVPGLISSFLLSGVAAAQALAPAPDVVRMEGPGRPISGWPAAPAEAYGPNLQTTVIPASAFVPGWSTYTYTNFFGDTITPSANGNQRWFAPLLLPSGAIVTEVGFLVTDSDAGSNITGYFLGECFPVSGPGPHGGGYFWTATSSGSGGDTVLTLTGSPLILTGRGLCSVAGSDVYDAYFYYHLNAYLETTSHSLSGAVVKWHRSVSAAPLTATFNDVPTSHPFFQFVEALFASGITAGCGGGNYCVDDPITRGQMAVFLAKALGLHWPE